MSHEREDRSTNTLYNLLINIVIQNNTQKNRAYIHIYNMCV